MLPPGAEADKSFWQARGIEALAVVPLVVRRSLQGFFSLGVGGAAHVWSGQETRFLHLVADLFSNGRGRYQAEDVIRKREQRYRTMIEYQREGTALVDDE